MQARKKGLVMVNFFSYFLTCSNESTIHNVVGEHEAKDFFRVLTQATCVNSESDLPFSRQIFFPRVATLSEGSESEGSL